MSLTSSPRLVPDPADEPTLTVERVAAIMSIARQSAYDAIGRGEIPAIRLGKRLLVPTAALRRLLDIDEDRA